MLAADSNTNNSGHAVSWLTMLMTVRVVSSRILSSGHMALRQCCWNISNILRRCAAPCCTAGSNGPLNPTPAFNPNPSTSLLGGGPTLPNIVEDIINVPGNALHAITQGVLGVMTQGGGPIHLPNLNLDRLPPAGLPFPIKQLNNLMSVLPKPDLLNVFKMFPMPPLAGLLSHLPIALEINH